MAYAASLEHLLHILHARAPAKVDALTLEKRRVRHGLLSVGLKVHCLGDEHLFAPFIAALGGESRVLDQNVYKTSRAKFCMVLPPVGSGRAAILLLESIEQYMRCPMFNNPNIQLQVCSPGRLTRRNAALHAIGFYLGSDTLRQYSLAGEQAQARFWHATEHDHEDVWPSDEGQPIGHCCLERRHSSGEQRIAYLNYEYDEERETYRYSDLEDPLHNARNG